MLSAPSARVTLASSVLSTRRASASQFPRSSSALQTSNSLVSHLGPAPRTALHASVRAQRANVTACVFNDLRTLLNFKNGVSHSLSVGCALFGKKHRGWGIPHTFKVSSNFRVREYGEDFEQLTSFAALRLRCCGGCRRFRSMRQTQRQR